MSSIKLTLEEIKKIVEESNRQLLEAGPLAPPPFTQSFPSISDEAVTARKTALVAYEKYVNTCLESLKSMVEQVNGDFTGRNLQKADVEYLISDQLGRLQDALNYTASSLRAIVENNGLKTEPGGAQYPAMMEGKKII
jgi:methyl-accepting chemotaxis protein